MATTDTDQHATRISTRVLHYTGHVRARNSDNGKHACQRVSRVKRVRLSLTWLKRRGGTPPVGVCQESDWRQPYV